MWNLHHNIFDQEFKDHQNTRHLQAPLEPHFFLEIQYPPAQQSLLTRKWLRLKLCQMHMQSITSVFTYDFETHEKLSWPCLRMGPSWHFLRRGCFRRSFQWKRWPHPKVRFWNLDNYLPFPKCIYLSLDSISMFGPCVILESVSGNHWEGNG